MDIYKNAELIPTPSRLKRVGRTAGKVATVSAAVAVLVAGSAAAREMNQIYSSEQDAKEAARAKTPTMQYLRRYDPRLGTVPESKLLLHIYPRTDTFTLDIFNQDNTQIERTCNGKYDTGFLHVKPVGDIVCRTTVQVVPTK